ncbi:hypothetical protein H0B56_12165 [Haloechinothrix sp. YIM 98757]|uniref:Uncharacterized protein n=1 Tax=Haloechinothrix aidingensis TaxID=2752311 RepID=A0A838AAP6_9PSEU|nr:DUF6221 family protein [Haloechinothrix aidingensis]MBA0126297.1 hypothetical protein [Haloechinothrix aidingensis]
MMDELAEFLRTQIDEDERVARAARPDYFTPEVLGQFSALGDARHVMRHDRARVLRDIEGRRAVLREYERAAESFRRYPDQEHAQLLWGLTVAARAVAYSYAGQPGYREEWRPHAVEGASGDR